MKKLLLPLEGNHYPQEILDFVAMMQPAAPCLLTAAFMPQADYAGLLETGLYQLATTAGGYSKGEEWMVDPPCCCCLIRQPSRES